MMKTNVLHVYNNPTEVSIFGDKESLTKLKELIELALNGDQPNEETRLNLFNDQKGIVEVFLFDDYE